MAEQRVEKMADYCIRAENLTKSFSGKGRNNSKVLYRDLSLAVRPGEIVGLFGPSGCGKSTLGDILLSLQLPDRGNVFWNGVNVLQAGRKKRKALRPLFQKIHQDPGSSFPPHQLVGEALYDIVRLRNPALAGEGYRQQMAAAAQEVHLDEKLLDRYPIQLSGGEIQRFALARALLNNPVFLVADEPTSRLDYSVQANIIRLLMRLAEKRRIGILLISHDRSLLQVACERIMTLKEEDNKI
ncbi:MAG: dipeptide/oligopeptide/nickel ABC transporter ATP-binding protein [Desulfobulbaceae bacterium]|nr:dipeptide/oligopeptide/nickel ABC transporter ATP-binding protein [Desulfobulbaceae bacterium]